MKNLQALNSTERTLFAQTFNEPGSYLFADSLDVYKIMLVKVVGESE